MRLSTLRECPHCGLWTKLGEPAPGLEMRCPRCDSGLRGVPRRSFDLPLATAVAGLLFYAVAVTTPLLSVMLYGRPRTGTLLTGPDILRAEGWWELGGLVFLTTVMLPAIHLLGVATVLLGLRRGASRVVLASLLRWVVVMRPWAMIEVYLLGLVVAYTRLTVLAWVNVDAAAFALAGLVLATLVTDIALDTDAVWSALDPHGEETEVHGGAPLLACHVCRKVLEAGPGRHCSRCGARVVARKRHSLSRTWALVAAAAVLYAPANIFPVMKVASAYPVVVNAATYVHTGSYTIFDGIRDLIAVGYWPTALLVLTASIVVPGFKVASLAFMLILTHRGSAFSLRPRTRLWRAIRFIGRWSMIDVCMISVVVALIRFGQLSRATTGAGMVCFAAVVILTMLATEMFDTRLMWDAAGGRQAGATSGRQARAGSRA